MINSCPFVLNEVVFETVGTLPDGETLRAGVPCVVSQSDDSAFEVLLRKNLRSREPLQSSTMYRLPTTAALAQQKSYRTVLVADFCQTNDQVRVA